MTYAVRLSLRDRVARYAEEDNEPGLLDYYNKLMGFTPNNSKILPITDAPKPADLSHTEAEIKAFCIRYCRNSGHTDLTKKYYYASRMIEARHEWTPEARAGMLAWLQGHLGYTPPAATLPATPAAPSLPANSAAIDPELARIAIALKLDHSLRIWAAIKSHLKTGRGAISLRKYPAVLRGFDIEMNARTRRQAIADGAGVFFRIDHKTGNLYLRSYPRVSEALMQRAQQTAPDVVATNRPGRQPRYIVLAGNSADFQAACYAAWHDMKADRAQGISMFTQRVLWQVTDNTLRSWRKLAGIEVVKGIAQYAGDNPDLLPPQNDDGTDRRDYKAYTVEGKHRHSWRVSNHYRAPSVPEKQTGRYTPRRVAAKCRAMQEDATVTELPCSDIGAAASNDGAGFSPTGRIYFAYTDANESRKRAFSHLKHFEDYQRAHYVQLAVKTLKSGDAVIYDVVDSTAEQTSAHERYMLAFPGTRSHQTKAGYRAS